MATPTPDELQYLREHPEFAPQYKARFGSLPSPFDGSMVPAPGPYEGLNTDQLKQKYEQLQSSGNTAGNLPRVADAYVQREAQDASPVGKAGLAADTVVRQLAVGVPVAGGLVDEGNAAASAAMGGNYDQSLDYQRARDRWANKVAPELTTGLNVAGGVGSAIAGGQIAGPEAFGINTTGGAATTPLPNRALIGGAVGAPVGAADAFARGEGGLENRAEAAKWGGAVGATAGLGVPLAAQGSSSAVQSIVNTLTSNQSLRRLGLDRGAANVLLRQLGIDDALLGGQGEAAIRHAGPDAMVADAGQGAADLLDTALARSGPGSRQARTAINQRAEGANQRLTGEMDRSLGQPRGIEARQADIRQQSAPARDAAYNAAYNSPIDYGTANGQRIANLWRQVLPRRRQAANDLLIEGGYAPIAEDALPNVQQIDYVTRALNLVAETGEGQGAMGGVNAAGRSAGTLARQLRDATRDAVPAYRAALQVAADPIRETQAVRLGQRFLTKNTTREEVNEWVQGATQPEIEALRGGVRDHLDEVTANVKRMASDPNIDARELREALGSLTSRASGEKLAAILGPRATRRFMTEVRQSMSALELRASVARNSRTYGRTSVGQQVESQIDPGIIGTVLEARPVDATKKAIQTITGRTPDRKLVLEDRIFGQIADALTRARGPDAIRYIRQLQRAAAARSASNRAGSVAGIAAGGAVIGSAPQGTPALQGAFR